MSTGGTDRSTDRAPPYARSVPDIPYPVLRLLAPDEASDSTIHNVSTGHTIAGVQTLPDVASP
eukprot:3159264-Rhodomonas_salina.2